MKNSLSNLLMLALLVFLAEPAQASVSCSVTSANITSGYMTTSGNTFTQESFTVNCNRSTFLDGNVTYSVQVDNGLYASGGSNQASNGSNKINYDFYTTSACSTQWQGVTNQAVTFSGRGTSASATGTFWACVPGNQIPSPAAGNYLDSVSMTLTYINKPVHGGTNTSIAPAVIVPVSVTVPPICSITNAPGNVVFGYTAFSATVVSASTTFGLTCSNTLGYSMSVSPATGVAAGINYTLSLSPSIKSTGLLQTYTITGSAPAGQAGTCTTGTCSASQLTTLTITY